MSPSGSGQFGWTEGPRLLDFGPGLLFICGLARMGLKKGSSGTEFLKIGRECSGSAGMGVILGRGSLLFTRSFLGLGVDLVGL